MTRENFVYDLDHIFEKFNMESMVSKARKANYRRVFAKENFPTQNAGVIDGLGKPLGEIKHTVDWVVKDYNLPTKEEDREWFMNKSSWGVAEALGEERDVVNEVVEYFSEILGLTEEQMQPRFLRQTRGQELRFHTDGVVNCAINYLLQGEQTPVVFRDHKEPINYKCGVFNTQALHMVPTLPAMGKHRLLFKLKIPRTGPTYEEVVDIVKKI